MINQSYDLHIISFHVTSLLLSNHCNTLAPYYVRYYHFTCIYIVILFIYTLLFSDKEYPNKL